MRIGVVSDTHVKSLNHIPVRILTKLTEVDLIVHAGDFTEMAVLEGLRTLVDVKAVCGNMDTDELKAALPRKDLFVANGKRIGLIHGSGGPWGIEKRVRQMFEDVEVIIFGHSHEARSQIIEGTLVFNPGRARSSFGLLTIEDKIKGEIIMV